MTPGEKRPGKTRERTEQAMTDQALAADYSKLVAG